MTVFDDIHTRYVSHTMSPQTTYLANLHLAAQAENIPGAIVEAGTWKGGMSAGIADLLGSTREYWLFDSFEGLPPVEQIDGQRAQEWTQLPDFDNCVAAEHDARTAMEFSVATNYHIVKGWFADTLPAAHFPDGIAFLRIDADFYTPMTEALDILFPHVNEGGIISIDDYYFLDGCAKALHDYLSKHNRAEKVEAVTDAPEWAIPNAGVAFIRKLAP